MNYGERERERDRERERERARARAVEIRRERERERERKRERARESESESAPCCPPCTWDAREAKHPKIHARHNTRERRGAPPHAPYGCGAGRGGLGVHTLRNQDPKRIFCFFLLLVATHGTRTFSRTK